VKRLHLALALVAAVMAVAAGAADLASPPEPRTSRERAGFIAAPDLAGRIMSGDARLRLFDLRPAAAFEQFHIPTARRASPADLAGVPLGPDTDVVLYGDDRETVSDAVRVLRTRRHMTVQVLREGVSEWLGRVHEPRLAVDATPEEQTQFERAAAMSRFFGGVPLAGVSRTEVPAGYWTGTPRSDALLEAAALQSVAMIRRRGC
jgi:rhodanese-related sulfurtransferase